MKIKVMSENLANKIAAGEVVEKCASVVKELVENSIDAGAVNIKISLVDGGIKGISIVDDGIGMDKEDAVLAFSRHATSKIYKDDDLFFIQTLGFRGEALASIASVSEVKMDTCSGDVGTHVHIKGGELLSVAPSEARKGTSIAITNLFYNTPARLKYLKSEATELNNCIAFIEKLALSRCDIAFTLTNNEKVYVKTSGSNNLLKAIHEIYGLNVSSNMLEIKASNDDFLVSGYVSTPSVLRKNRNHFNTFINQRIIKNMDINRAINDAYNTYKHEGFYPIVVINIDVDPTLVDVNIHPTKQDVKLSKMQDLTDMIYKTIKEALYANLLIPDMIDDVEEETVVEEEQSEEVKEYRQVSFDFANNVSEEKEEVKNAEFKKLKLYPVGQVHGTYIIAEDEDAMYIIDQHAAHERINYERVLKKLGEGKPLATDLIVPVHVELNASDYQSLQSNWEFLESMGFVIEEFGINTVIVKRHPLWLIKGSEEDNIKAIIDLVIEHGEKFDKEKFLDSMAKMMSCKMSIKANGHLSREEMEKLLDDLMECDNPYNCCHGRPLIIKYTTYDLEKLFKRVL